MALWQYYLELFPRKEIEKYFGLSVECFPEDYYKIDWWNDTQYIMDKKTKDYLNEKLSDILELRKNDEEISMWGDYDSNLIDIGYENNIIIGISIRLDLTEINPHLIRSFLDITKYFDCYMIDKSLKIIQPDINQLFEEIKLSSAFRFLENPSKFFSDLEKNRIN